MYDPFIVPISGHGKQKLKSLVLPLCDGQRVRVTVSPGPW